MIVLFLDDRFKTSLCVCLLHNPSHSVLSPLVKIIRRLEEREKEGRGGEKCDGQCSPPLEN